jgi:hypothetical protein
MTESGFDGFRLIVGGLVKNPLELSLVDLERLGEVASDSQRNDADHFPRNYFEVAVFLLVAQALAINRLSELPYQLWNAPGQIQSEGRRD